MSGIAAVHVLWLLLFPVGVFFCVRGLEKRSYLAAGITLIVLSIPAKYFLRGFWPFDYLGPVRTRVITLVGHAGWKVCLRQTPDVDFYHTDFLLVSPDGWSNNIVYDADDYKWWRAESAIRTNRIYFLRGKAGKDESPSHLELEREVFWWGYHQREEQLANPAQEQEVPR